TPVEALDAGYDFFRIHSYELAPDSFGHGAHRGGAGFYRRYEILRDGVTFSMYADHFRHPPEGFRGGSPGACGHARIIRGEQTIELTSKGAHPLRKGDIVELLLGGGGGYGAPADRDHGDVERDLADGLLRPETARRIYARREAAE
ncbi:MAG: hydantoinase B/oxoprolinase family protein, partial [Alphaproteobacteria bacterium]